MKRVISVLSAAVMLLGLCACGSGAEQDHDTAAYTVSESDIAGKTFVTKYDISEKNDEGAVVTNPFWKVTFEPDGTARYSLTGNDLSCDWSIEDGMIHTTDPIYDATSFRYWNGYLVTTAEQQEGTIPEGDRFEANVRFQSEKEHDDGEAEITEQTVQFHNDGKAVVKAIVNGEELPAQELLYERDGDIISILRETAGGNTQLSFYILSADGTPYRWFLVRQDRA